MEYVVKKVIIIGAGAQATVLCGVLSQAEDVSRIVLTDIDEARAQEIAETNGSAKIVSESIDASDVNQMSARMKSETFDLAINATIPMFVRQVLEAAYNARIDYLDMASNEIYPQPDIPIEQLAYAQAWDKAGLRCLTGGGGDPGLTNIMVKDAVLELDEVDSIRIKDYGIVECDHPVALWSMRTYLEDLYLPATIWQDGKPKLVLLFSGREDYDFPPPLGLRGRCYFHDHEEGVTIPLFCGKPVKYCDFKIGEPDIDTWKFLIQGLGLMDKEPIDIGGCRASPRDMLFQKIPETASPRKQIELYSSGQLSSHLMLLRSQVKHTGVFPPEVFDREEIDIFYRGIREWGIRVIKQTEAPTV